MNQSIAIIGQSGQLLDKLLGVLEQSNLAQCDLYLLSAVADDAGASTLYKGKPLGFQHIDSQDFNHVDLVLFLESQLVFSAYKDKLLALACPVIVANADQTAPVKELIFSSHQETSSNTYYLATPLSIALKEMFTDFTVEALDLTLLCSADFFTQAGINELASQTAKLLNAQPIEQKVFSKQLPFNCFPLAEHDLGKAYQHQIIQECCFCFATDEVQLSAVQMPLFHGKTLLASATLSNKIDLDTIQSTLKNNPSVSLLSSQNLSHLSVESADTDVVIGNITCCDFDEYRFNFWLTIDTDAYLVNSLLMPLVQKMIDKIV